MMHDLRDTPEPISPIGTAIAADDEQWARDDPAYRAQQDARAPYREIAWMLIKYRMDHGLTQEQLAERAGTSSAQIARIERGRQKTNLETLLRIAHALNLKVVLGFEGTAADGTSERQTVAL
jgi:DNA-binding XRE family transcriptional regulator